MNHLPPEVQTLFMWYLCGSQLSYLNTTPPPIFAAYVNTVHALLASLITTTNANVTLRPLNLYLYTQYVSACVCVLQLSGKDSACMVSLYTQHNQWMFLLNQYTAS